MLAAVILHARTKKYKQFVAMTSFGSSLLLLLQQYTAWYYYLGRNRSNSIPPPPTLRDVGAPRRQAEGPMRSVLFYTELTVFGYSSYVVNVVPRSIL